MASLNTVALVGRAGRDPEVRYFDNGSSVATFTIAVDGWSKDAGERNTSWVDCKAWGKTAQTVADYVRKGSLIGVTGRLEQERWETKAGEKRSKLVVVVNSLQLLTPRDQGQGQSQGYGQAQGYAPADLDEEVPF